MAIPLKAERPCFIRLYGFCISYKINSRNTARLLFHIHTSTDNASSANYVKPSVFKWLNSVTGLRYEGDFCSSERNPFTWRTNLTCLRSLEKVFLHFLGGFPLRNPKVKMRRHFSRL